MLFTRNPFSEMFRIQKEMDQILNHFNHQNAGSKYLPVNIEGNEKGSVLSLELPGISLEEIQLSVEKSSLLIRVKRIRKEEEGVRYHLQERLHGEWERTLKFSHEIDAEKVEAVYEKGILYISLPKKESELAKKIEIKKL